MLDALRRRHARTGKENIHDLPRHHRRCYAKGRSRPDPGACARPGRRVRRPTEGGVFRLAPDVGAQDGSGEQPPVGPGRDPKNGRRPRRRPRRLPPGVRLRLENRRLAFRHGGARSPLARSSAHRRSARHLVGAADGLCASQRRRARPARRRPRSPSWSGGRKRRSLECGHRLEGRAPGETRPA
uniref:LigA n=1 Tax=Parastrongyloides trichosuri TaxID=131310 RepID=A0A0N4Z8D6_PARTI